MSALSSPSPLRRDSGGPAAKVNERRGAGRIEQSPRDLRREGVGGKPSDARRKGTRRGSSDGHSAITEGGAHRGPAASDGFDASDGCDQETTLELEASRRVVPTWRPPRFADDDEDARIEVPLEGYVDATLVTVRPRNVPSDHRDCQDGGWQMWYVTTMNAYFEEEQVAVRASRVAGRHANLRAASAVARRSRQRGRSPRWSQRPCDARRTSSVCQQRTVGGGSGI
ncbi:MAG: SRPBCC family protein [Acidimicrobiales bacterium]